MDSRKFMDGKPIVLATVCMVFAATITACDSGSDTKKSNALTDPPPTEDSPPDTSPEGPENPEVPEANITWHQHVAPLLMQRCGACHVADGIAPFSVETYDQAQPMAGAMAQQIANGTMPPWGARETEECVPPAAHKGDLRLSQEEKNMFQQWVDQGTAEGDASDSAPITAPQLDILEDPQRQITMPAPVEVPAGDDRFVCFRLEINNPEKVWLTGSQIFPGNTTVAHHALVFMDPNNESAALAGEDDTYDCFGGPGISDTQLVGVWAPGVGPTRLPADTGTPLAPNSVVVVQMHYHPAHHGSSAEIDATTRYDVSWTTEAPAYVGTTFLFGNSDQVDDPNFGGEGFGLTTGPDFRIPAGAAEHVEVNRLRLPPAPQGLENLPIRVWQAATHMHFVGTDMKITVNADQPDEQCLVQTPQWDYRWQRLYFYDVPVQQAPSINFGDTLTLRCTYNNTLQNPYVVEALAQQGLSEPVDVYLGDETLDEMCIAALGFAVPAEYGQLFGL